MPSALRRVLVTAAVVLFLFILIGATYQGVATAVERRRFPYPGRMVDVGGHQLHLYCTGQGAPTVVLEAPATAMSAAWNWVQTDLAKTTRVCSYDRAGLGWSEAGEAAFSPDTAVTELNTMLMRAGERAPFVLAGAEYGAALATLYAGRYPGRVEALVVVNPPDAVGSRPVSTPSTRFVSASPWLARVGVLRASRTLSRTSGALPQPSAGVVRAFLNRPDHLTRAAAELAQWAPTVGLSDAVTLRPGMPLIQVEVNGPDRIGLVSDRRNAADIVSAIERAVRNIRTAR